MKETIGKLRMLDKLRKVKEVEKEGLSVESNPLLGYVSVRADEDAYLIEDTVIDEGKYRTVITISLAPLATFKGKEVKKGLLSLS